MKNEPCIRLGMRIRPKMREKPDDSRNSKPPSAMLFTVKVSHRLMFSLSPLAGRGNSHRPDACSASVLQVFGRRIVARVDRARQKILLWVGPELAHVRVGLDHRVDQLAVLLLAAADEHLTDHI